MELRDALTQIAEIRQQMARSEVFRGYRSATTAFSGVVAIVAATLQANWVEEYSWQALYLWLAAAGLSLAVVGVEMAVRYRRSESVLQREITLMAVEQFAPCLVAGALLTYVVSEFAGRAFSLLPGIWCVLFSLGVFASRRFLPRGTFVVGAWYLLAGLLCIALRQPPDLSRWGARSDPAPPAVAAHADAANGPASSSDYAARPEPQPRFGLGFAAQMGIAFGGGQLLAAGVLYWTLERNHGRE